VKRPRDYPSYAAPSPPPGPYAPSGPPPGGVAPSAPAGTNGMAIASFVVSLLWFFGLGSLIAVFFGIVARRQIRESGGTQGGDGLAVAGIVLGALGIVGAVLFVAVGAILTTKVTSAINATNGQSTGQTAVLNYGHAATIPVDPANPSGIATITVESLSVPVSGGAFGQALPGSEFAAALVQVCAGAGGVQGGLDTVGWDLFFPDGTTAVAVNNAQTPALDQINALGAGECGSGYITFSIPAGSTPDGVEYSDGPDGTFKWGP
jgi:uncharacterized protein DUF4190